MNGIDIVSELIGLEPELVTLVADRVFAGSVPIGTALPAIGLHILPGSKARGTAPLAGGPRLWLDRVRGTIYGASYEEKDLVFGLFQRACDAKIGTFAGLERATVHLDDVGGDHENEEASIFAQTQDLRVGFLKPA